jgi:hypothetical protein
MSDDGRAEWIEAFAEEYLGVGISEAQAMEAAVLAAKWAERLAFLHGRSFEGHLQVEIPWHESAAAMREKP